MAGWVYNSGSPLCDSSWVNAGPAGLVGIFPCNRSTSTVHWRFFGVGSRSISRNFFYLLLVGFFILAVFYILYKWWVALCLCVFFFKENLSRIRFIFDRWMLVDWWTSLSARVDLCVFKNWTSLLSCVFLGPLFQALILMMCYCQQKSVYDEGWQWDDSWRIKCNDVLFREIRRVTNDVGLKKIFSRLKSTEMWKFSCVKKRK